MLDKNTVSAHSFKCFRRKLQNVRKKMTNIIIQRWLARTCGLVVCWKCLLSFFAPCGRGLSSIYVTYVIGLFASRSSSSNRLVIFLLLLFINRDGVKAIRPKYFVYCLSPATFQVILLYLKPFEEGDFYVAVTEKVLTRLQCFFLN